MVKKANLVVVQHGKHELFYSHWRANTLPQDLFWSPEFATAFIRKQHKVNESTWLENIWAEGGAIVDWDAKIFLFFGGEEILYDVPLRCIYLELISRVWRGWQIKWAHQGIADLANYLNYPLSNIIREQNNSLAEYNVSLPQKNWTDIVGSIIFEDLSLGLFPLSGDLVTLLQCGSSLIDKIQQQQGFGLKMLLLDRWTNRFPLGGFHIDINSKTLEFWLAFPVADIYLQVAKCWSGWNVIWHRDLFEFQIERTRGKLKFFISPCSFLEEKVKRFLLTEELHIFLDNCLDLPRQEQLKINPWQLRRDRFKLPLKVRLKIINSALATTTGNK
jgi:hypothetical protein